MLHMAELQQLIQMVIMIIVYSNTYSYRRAQFIAGGNIDGLASLRNLKDKILTDSMLDNMY